MAESSESKIPPTHDHERNLPPPPPDPSLDTGLLRLSPSDNPDDHPTTSQDIDIFALSSIAALKLLCAGVEWLVRMTGDVPPTPPNELAEPMMYRNMRGMLVEKENIVRSTSGRDLVGMGRGMISSPKKPTTSTNTGNTKEETEHDGISLRKKHTPTDVHNAPTVTEREERKEPLEPYLVIGENAEPLNIQHSAITRKFYCKSPPNISLEDYLLRIHTFCPMSCAVYLAASYYIHRLAIIERAIPVTRRNCHRLLLAGLRVAMKALEDMSYSHGRIARVGGVSARELVVLEVSFCFLTGFEVQVGEGELRRHVGVLREVQVGGMGMGGVGWVPRLPGKIQIRGGGVKVVGEVVQSA